MKKSNDPANPFEWEAFGWPTDFTKIQCQKKLYEIPFDSVVTVSRDGEFRLSATITGLVDDTAKLDYQPGGQIPAGAIMQTEVITGFKDNMNRLTLSGVVLLGNQSTGKTAYPNPKFSFSSKLLCSRLEYEAGHSDDQKVAELLEFFVCGTSHFSWPRVTKRIAVTKRSKTRIGIDEEIDEPTDLSAHSSSSGQDYFLIETDKLFIIVQKVIGNGLPEWSSGLQFEYRSKKKGIPDEEERKAIAELVGFVMGTELIKIGESQFDQQDLLIKKIAISPISDNIVQRCAANARPPVSINNYQDWGKIERVINLILPAYLQNRDRYHLADVFWKYWIALSLPIGTNLPILSSGLETLAESYVKSNGLVYTYTKEEKSAHKILIATELETLNKKLEPFDYKKRIIDKLEQPFTIGVGEKLKLFFLHLGMKFAPKDIENRAMQARNAMTHGALDTTGEEVRKYITLTHAYESLFNRILLKILGYSGDYIDYSAPGHPSLGMDENLEGKLDS